MKIELKFKTKDFIDMIKMMAVPSKSSKEHFLYPVIFPQIKEGYIEWIIRGDVTTWVTVKYTEPTGLPSGETKPVRIPIDAAKMLERLKLYKSDDLLYFTHDTDKDFDLLSDNYWDDSTVVEIARTHIKPNPNDIFEGFPAPLDENEVIQFRNGTLKPHISGSCSVEFMKKVIKNAEELDLEKKNSKKNEDVTAVINLKVDGDLHKIEAVAGDEVMRVGDVIRNKMVKVDIKGFGELHYTKYLPDVIGVLSGDIKFFAINRGPLWIMHDTEKVQVRYLVPPAAQGTYRIIYPSAAIGTSPFINTHTSESKHNQNEIAKLETDVKEQSFGTRYGSNPIRY